MNEKLMIKRVTYVVSRRNGKELKVIKIQFSKDSLAELYIV